MNTRLPIALLTICCLIAGCRTAEPRQETLQVFLDFFDVPEDDPARSRPGIYQAHTFETRGRRIQVVPEEHGWEMWGNLPPRLR